MIKARVGGYCFFAAIPSSTVLACDWPNLTRLSICENRETNLPGLTNDSGERVSVATIRRSDQRSLGIFINK